MPDNRWEGPTPLKGQQWWRLEIHGRPGWFIPATEGHFALDREEPDVHHALVAKLRRYGYAADAELDETYHLRRIP